MKMIKHPFSGRFDSAGRDIGYDYRRKVGAYVRDLREGRGLTQRELGKAVGIGSNAVSAIELGRNPIPPERYGAFAEALGANPKKFGLFLLEWTDPWLFGLIYGEDKVRHHGLDKVPDRMATVDD